VTHFLFLRGRPTLRGCGCLFFLAPGPGVDGDAPFSLSFLAIWGLRFAIFFSSVVSSDNAFGRNGFAAVLPSRLPLCFPSL